MSQVLITGATGLVGGHLLRMLINTPQVSAIAAPTRRPLTDIVGVYNPHDPPAYRCVSSGDRPGGYCFLLPGHDPA